MESELIKEIKKIRQAITALTYTAIGVAFYYFTFYC